MILYGSQTWVDAILTAMAAKLATVPGFSVAQVFESLADDADHLGNPPSDRFLTVRPMAFPVGVPGVTGGGRLLTGFDGTFRVGLFCRVSSDQEFRDARLLKDATRGILKQLQGILSALQMLAPLDADGACILREPMRVRSFDIQPRRVGKSPWAVAASVWEAKFQSSIPA